jgi:hypothetical protein
VPLPKINEKNKIRKSSSMLELHGKNRVKYINEELNKINKFRINSFDIKNKRYKQSNNLNKKYKYRIKKKIEIKNGQDINKSMELKNKTNKIQIKVTTSPQMKTVKRNPQNNYLKKFENNMFKSSDWMNDYENKAINIQNVKNQIEALEDKVKRKQIILKMKRGTSDSDKVVNDISNLIVNSIKGKLSVIKAINSE